MECKRCKKKFNEAGNVRDYYYVCPYCNYSHNTDEVKEGWKMNKDRDDMDKKLAFLCDCGYTEGQLNWFGRNPHRVDEFCEKHGFKMSNQNGRRKD